MRIELSRRGFVCGAAAVASLRTNTGFAQPIRRLTASKRSIEVLGRSAEVYGISDEAGRQGVIALEGERFSAIVANRIGGPLTLHWHGQVHASASQDRSRPEGGAIPDGGADMYAFDLTPGTHWMHAHSLHEQRLLAAPMVTRERDAGTTQDVIVMLHDFSFRTPEEILADLKRGASEDPHRAHAVSPPRMRPSHANDVVYDAFIANDRTLDDPEIVRVEAGGTVRLRIINAGTATAFFLETGGSASTCVAVDGSPCLPLSMARYPLAQGQRIDLLAEIPRGGGAFPVLAQVEGSRRRTGVVLATAGAAIRRLSSDADSAAPQTDLSFEEALRARDPLAQRAADRSVRVVLGEGPNYEWTINGLVHGRDRAIEARAGERLEIQFMNPTSMMHPMHLHGNRFQVVGTRAGRYQGPVRDTVIVPPHSPVAVHVELDKPGRWYLHCHHLYHMAAGMMAELRVT